MVHYFMQQTMTITAPHLPQKIPFIQFIFTLLFLSILGTGSFYLAVSSYEIPIYIRLLSIALSMLFIFTVPYAIFARYQMSKRFAVLNKEGIMITFDTIKYTVVWENITSIALTYVVYSFEKLPREGDPYFVFTITDPTLIPPTITTKKRGKRIYFVALQNDLRSFIGVQEKFSFALNIKNAPEMDPTLLFAKAGKTFTTIPPIMDVKDAREYNLVVKEMYSEEKIKEYLLPEN